MPLNGFPIPSFRIRVIRAIRGPPPSVVYFREPVVEDLTTNRTNRTNRVIGCEFTERDRPWLPEKGDEPRECNATQRLPHPVLPDSCDSRNSWSTTFRGVLPRTSR
jgi:hypothetical protein